MMSDAEEARAHFSALADLAARLAVQARAVYHHRYDYLAFGSWALEAGTRKRRVRFTWDGRDSHLTAELARFGDSGSVPAWRRVAEREMPAAAAADLFAAVERLVVEHTKA